MKSVSRSIGFQLTINPHIFQYVFDRITPISLIYELSSPLESAVICVGKNNKMVAKVFLSSIVIICVNNSL